MTRSPGRDAAGFSSLYDRTFTDIWSYVRRRVASRSDADDVTAEVFAVAWRRVEELPPLDEQRPWLFGVARNVVRNHQRSRTRQQRLQAKLVGQRPGPSSAAADGSGGDRELWAALAELSEDDRELLLMRAWDRLPVTTIAQLLGCTPNAASVRLHKARTRLRVELEGPGGGKDRCTSGDGSLEPATKGEPDDRTA